MSKSAGVVSRLIDQISDLTLKTRSIEEAPFGITIADVRKEDEPLIYANDGFKQVTGYAEEEILGRNCRFLQGPETREEPVAKMRAALENEESVQVELRNYRKDGEQFWCEVTLAPLEVENGEVTHYVGFQQDVSERKDYEIELEKQRDDLHLLNEMVRHDIRNNLQVALAATELLDAQYVDGDGQEQITAALESIQQAIELTNVAREVAEVMLDGESDHHPVELAPVLETEIGEFRSAYPDARIDIEGSIPQVEVEANDLLGSVFRNLLKNAVVHNDAETPKVRVSATVRDDHVRVVISDNGPGIPEAKRESVFERGWTGGGGTGLGLYIVRRLLQNYGGEITLLDDPADDAGTESDEFGGATFAVELPLAG